MFARLAVALVLVCVLGGAYGAEVLLTASVPTESITAAQRRTAALGLAKEAARRLEEEKPATSGLQEQLFTEAIDDYQRLVEESGDKLLPLDARGRTHCVQARWLVAFDLSRLPTPALRVYRNRVDNQARKWLEQGRTERDAALLQRIVDEAFCSSFGDDALDLLGDLAFERGRFDEAERWWRHIVVPADEASRKPDADDLQLLFPDPDVDAARIRAKQILARWFAGAPRERLHRQIEAYRVSHPKAEGRLGDRQGNYADILDELMSRPESADEGDITWPTFAGAASRGRVLPTDPRDPNRLLRLLRDGETHRFSLEDHERLPNVKPDALPPGIVGKAIPPQADARRLAFHPAIVGPWVIVANGRSVAAHHAVSGDTHTWNLANGNRPAPLAFPARLPAEPDLRCTVTVAEGRIFARLGAPRIGPDLKGDDAESYLVCLDLPPGRDERWIAPGRAAFFEGAPVAVGGRVCIAATRFAAGQTITSIRCYSADARGEAAIRWEQDVCTAPELKPGEVRYRHHLLTLAGPHLVYCSQNGVIAAVDARTGRPAWAVRYPSRGLRLGPDEVTPRDLTPCLYAAGRVYAAPADHDRLMCLDPVSGRTMWERRIEVVHLYGVSHGRLIFTTPGGIRAIDAATGKDEGGWIQPAVGGALQPVAGEGLATGEDDGLPSFGRGILAGDYVFWPTRRRLWVLSVRDGEQPDDLIPGELEKVPPGNLVLGDGILAVAGTNVLSIFTTPALLKAKRAAAVRAAPESPKALYELGAAHADSREFSAALREFKLAERNAGEQSPFAEESRRRQREVLCERSAALRTEKRWDEADTTLQAAAQGADANEQLARLADRSALWEQADQPLRAVALWQAFLETAPPQSSARRTAVAHLDTLIRRHGRTAYAEVETRAAQALAEAKQTEDLERIASRFPHSTSAAAALSQLAQVYTRVGREGLAAHALRLATRQPDGPARSAAMTELARSYERRGLTSSCDNTALLDLPLTQGWQRLTPAGEHLLAVAGSASIFADDRRLICRERASGATRWVRTLPGSITWAGRYADAVVVAGPTGVFALTQDDGTILWRLTLPGGTLSSFQLEAGRVYLLHDGRRLVAAEADTGSVLWSRAAPGWSLGGRFQPRLLVVGDRVLAQTSSARLWVLEGRTGAILHEQPTGRDAWPRSPLHLGENRVALTEDSRTVTLLDLTDGRTLGRPLADTSTLHSGVAPLLAGNSESVALLQLRNHGTTLQCADARTVALRWAEEQQVSRNPADDLAVDAVAAYTVCGGEVSSFSLRDGKRRWQRVLPGSGKAWRLIVCRGGVVAYAAEPGIFHASLDFPLGRWSLTTPWRRPFSTSCAIHILDPESGELVQRVNLPPIVPQMEVARSNAWGLAFGLKRTSIAVQVDPHGLVGSAPGVVFGRRSREP